MDAKKNVAQIVLLKLKKGVWNDKDTYEIQTLAETARNNFQSNPEASKICFSAYYTAAGHIFTGKVFCGADEIPTALVIYGLAFRFLLATVKAAAALAKVGSVLDEMGDKLADDGEALVKFLTTLLLSALTQKELNDRQSAAPYQALLLLERIQPRLYGGEEDPSRVRIIGRIARSVAIVLHEQGHTQLASRAMLMACRLYLLWSQAGDFDECLVQCDLAKNFLLLASYQLHKNREVEQGLQSLVWVITLSPVKDIEPRPSDAIIGRMKQWCIQKRNAVEGGANGAENALFSVQLRSCLGLCPQRDTAEIQHALLSAFMYNLIRHSYGSLDECMAVADGLLSTVSAKDVEGRCDVLLQKLVLLHTSSAACLKDYLSVCDDGISLVVRSKRGSWMLGVFKMIQCVFMFEAMSPPDQSGDTSVSDLSSDILRSTYDAIASWQVSLCERKSETSGEDGTAHLPQAFKAMSWAIHFLRLMGQPLDEIVACRLLSSFVKKTRLVQLHGTCFLTAAVEVISSSCIALASLGAVQHAACLLLTVEALGGRAKLSAHVSSQITLQLDLARAAVASQCGEIDRCIELLSSAARHSVRSFSNGQFLSIAARVSHLDPCLWSNECPVEDQDSLADMTVTAPQLALWSFHSCRSRLKHVTGESSGGVASMLPSQADSNGSKADEACSDYRPHNCLYNVIHQYLDCCRLGARVYLYAGCPAEACSFVAQGLSLAKQHCLGNWENRFNLIQMECDVHSASASGSSSPLQCCECDCAERGLASLSVQTDETIPRYCRPASCCTEGHTDGYVLEKANCTCNESLLVKAEHRPLSAKAIEVTDFDISIRGGQRIRIGRGTAISIVSTQECLESFCSWLPAKCVTVAHNCIGYDARVLRAAADVMLKEKVRQGEYDSALDSQLWKGSLWESQRCVLIARHHIHAGKTGLAKDHCEKGLDNFDLWPPTSEAASVARLSMAQRGCVAELLYLLTKCLFSTPPCQQYIAQSWLQTPASSQPSSEQLPSPEDTPPVAKRQSRRPPSTSKTRKPAATGKRRTSKSAVSMALSATASQSATSSSSTATAAPAEEAVTCKAYLERAYHIACNTAAVPVWIVRDMCLALGNFEGYRNLQSSANYFQAAHAISLRYQLHHHISLQAKPVDSGVSMSVTDVVKCLSNQRQQGHTSPLVDYAVASLPKDWTVCSLNRLQVPGSWQSYLVVSRMHASHVSLVRLPMIAEATASRDEEQSKSPEASSDVFDDLRSIMVDAVDSLAIKSKQKFWAKRKTLDNQLALLLDHLEGGLLGAWRIMLNGQPVECQRDPDVWRAAVASGAEALCKYTPASNTVSSGDQNNVAEMLLELCLSSWDDRSAFSLSLAVFLGLDTGCATLKKLVTALRQACMGLEPSSEDSVPSHPVVLVSDKALQQLPWESMVCLQDQAVSRMPSLALLLTHLSYRQKPSRPLDRFLMDGIDADDTYYVLNPEKNLPDTQKMFERWFNEHENWQGVVGCAPSADEFSQGLCEKELFIYCGHGNGSMFLGRKRVEKLQCRAVTMLMGCSSGKLRVDGDMDEQGTVLSYLLAGCPAVVAMLWDVTDRDLDRFTDSLLRNWIGSRRQLLEFINGAREECRLPHLTGAAPVVYGLPVKCS